MCPWFSIAWDFLTTEFISCITVWDISVKKLHACIIWDTETLFCYMSYCGYQTKTNYIDFLFLIKHLELCLIFTCLDLILLFYSICCFVYLFIWCPYYPDLISLLSISWVLFLFYISPIFFDRVLFFWLFCHNKIV